MAIFCVYNLEKMFRVVARRAYSASRLVRAAEPAAAGEGDLIVNFSTPHEPIVTKKVVTKGHAATISQLQPGVVSITNVGVSSFILFLQ